jgi:hypothetical protein
VYAHNQHTGGATALTAMPDQQGIAGQFLSAWSRDFFAVQARPA